MITLHSHSDIKSLSGTGINLWRILYIFISCIFPKNVLVLISVSNSTVFVIITAFLSYLSHNIVICLSGDESDRWDHANSVEIPQDSNRCCYSLTRMEADGRGLLSVICKKCWNGDPFYCNTAIAVPRMSKKHLPTTSFKSHFHGTVKWCISFDIQELSVIHNKRRLMFCTSSDGMNYLQDRRGWDIIVPIQLPTPKSNQHACRLHIQPPSPL